MHAVFRSTYRSKTRVLTLLWIIAIALVGLTFPLLALPLGVLTWVTLVVARNAPLRSAASGEVEPKLDVERVACAPSQVLSDVVTLMKVRASVSDGAGLPETAKTKDLPTTVLVVDDDPAMLRLIARITASAGYRVIEAGSGSQALDCVRTQCPDILVTDWEMPGLDGLQLCRALRQEALPVYIHIVLLTAKSSTEEMVEGIDAGADDFLSKPIEPAVLLARLKAGARSIAVDRRLRDMARLDPLTGTLNRRSFHEQAAAEWDRSSRYEHSLACVMVDLDFFKRVNDSYGHAAGDAVLQGVARLLDTHRRASDILARCGGEEFCLLLSETTERGAVAWAERVRRAIVQARIPFAGQCLNVTASFGIAIRLADTGNLATLTSMADQALSVAKETGRNRVVTFRELDDAGGDPASPTANHAPLSKVLAGDVMAPAVYCPSQHDTIRCVADLLLQLRLNAAPVVNDVGHLVGVIAETDLLAAITSASCLDTPVGQIMRTTNVVQYDENTPAKEVLGFLSRASVPRVVVVKGSRPTGVISRATMLRWLRNWCETQHSLESTEGDMPTCSRRLGMMKAAGAAIERLQAFRGFCETPDAVFAPCAIAEATRLEGLAHDILTQCRGLDWV